MASTEEMSQGLTGQAKWSATHKEKNPTGEYRRKEKQRQLERVRWLHITREHLYGHPIPAWIDQSEDVFIRTKARYMATLEEQVVKEEK